MADKTGISWTDATWNPIRGCSRVSNGCENCYAEKVAHRFSGPGQPYEGLTRNGRWNGEIKLVPKVLDQPLRWQKPRRIFVNSMSDLFHEGVPDEYIDRVFGVMALSHQHTFQILTKRPERMREYLTDGDRWFMVEGSAQYIEHDRTGEDPSLWLAVHGPLPNVHLGISVENQETADERIPLLLQTPAAVRFISAEPLLGAIDLQHIAHENGDPDHFYMTLSGDIIDGCMSQNTGLDWVIIGGESGPGARPCNVDWIREIVEQCRGAGVPCFVKQLGARPYLDVIGGESTMDVSEWFGGAEVDWDDNWEAWKPMLDSHKGSDPSEWPEDIRVQEFPS